jgi:hypothetical protein
MVNGDPHDAQTTARGDLRVNLQPAAMRCW